jgi:hypothetical protein
MKALLVVVVLLVIGIAGLGWYLGWFRLSTDGTDQAPSATITLDKDKIHSDAEVVKDKVQGLGHTAKEKASEPTEKVEQ